MRRVGFIDMKKGFESFKYQPLGHGDQPSTSIGFILLSFNKVEAPIDNSVVMKSKVSSIDACMT